MLALERHDSDMPSSNDFPLYNSLGRPTSQVEGDGEDDTDQDTQSTASQSESSEIIHPISHSCKGERWTVSGSGFSVGMRERMKSPLMSGLHLEKFDDLREHISKGVEVK